MPRKYNTVRNKLEALEAEINELHNRVIPLEVIESEKIDALKLRNALVKFRMEFPEYQTCSQEFRCAMVKEHMRLQDIINPPK